MSVVRVASCLCVMSHSWGLTKTRHLHLTLSTLRSPHKTTFTVKLLGHLSADSSAVCHSHIFDSSDKSMFVNSLHASYAGKARYRVAPCGLRGCKNRAHSVSWLEVIKGITSQGLDCFVS